MLEGYILFASGNQKYYRLAARAARSIRYFDHTREICLACDDLDSIVSDDRPCFDRVVRLTHVESRRGTEHQIYLNQISPFDRTFYVDADCLMASSRIHEIWNKMKDFHVTFPGNRRTTGEWRRLNIEAVRSRFGLDYVLQINGGAFYFDRSEESERFFSLAQSLFEARHPEITQKHVTGGGIANEPIWGVSMPLARMGEFPLAEQLNVSTLRTQRWSIDSTPSITLWKDGGTRTPVLCHFLGLDGPKCPNDLYWAFVAVIEERSSVSKGDQVQ